MRHAVKVNFDNGDNLETEINGTYESIRQYYLGKTFNLGNGENDLMAKCVSISFPDMHTDRPGDEPAAMAAETGIDYSTCLAMCNCD